MNETIGNCISDFLEGQLSEQEDSKIRKLENKDVFKLLQKTGIISKYGGN